MPFGRGVVLTVRAGLSSLRLISPFVRSRAASLAGAAALLVAYSAAAVSPALITQQLVDRGLAAGDVPLVAALALALVAAAAAQSVLSVLAARVLSEAGEGVAADLRAELARRALDAPAGWMAGRDDGYVAARVTEASGVSALFSKTSFAFASSASGGGLRRRRGGDEPRGARLRPRADPRLRLVHRALAQGLPRLRRCRRGGGRRAHRQGRRGGVRARGGRGVRRLEAGRR